MQRAEIENLRRQAADLLAEAEKAEEALNRLAPDEKAAEELHNLLCRANHIDACGWFYEAWESPGWARKDYLSRIKKMIPILMNDYNLDIEEAMKIFRVIKDTK